MPNPFVNLLGSLSAFGRQPQQPGMGAQMPVGNVQIPPVQQQQPMQNQMQQYQPSFDMQNRFSSLLDQMPQPNNPNIWQKIGASIGGMGTQQPFQAAQQMAYAPYFNELANWKMRAPFMQQAADNERLTNTQGLTYNNQMLQRQFERDELKSKDKIAEGKQEVAEKNAESRRLRDEAYAAKLANPDIKFQVIDGALYALDPATGQPVDTGVRGLSKMEELRFTADAAQKRVETQQAGATQRTGMQQTGANERNEATIAGAMERTEAQQTGANTRATNRSTSAGSYSPITLRKVRAQDILNQRPDLAQYVDANGNVAEADKPGGIRSLFGGISKFDETTRKALVDYIEGKPGAQIPVISTAPIANTPGMPSLPAGSTVTGRASGTTAPAGRIVVEKDGQQFSLPAGQLSDAIKQGYKQVK